MAHTNFILKLHKGHSNKGLWGLRIFTELLTCQDQGPSPTSTTDGSVETYTILNHNIVPKFQAASL